MAKLSIRDLDLKNKTVFIRVDFNVPLASGGKEITSDKRIRASLPTIRYALEQGAGVILASHLGRPKGKPNPEMSLKPVAARLSELLGKPVKMAPDCIGPDVAALLGPLLAKYCCSRICAITRGREERSRVFEATCRAGDFYVNDAFGSAHRAHASTVGMIAVHAQSRRGRPADGQGTGVPDQGHHEPRAAVRGDPRRREGVRQDRSDSEPAQVRG
jgi:phosphoglycerate kinase